MFKWARINGTLKGGVMLHLSLPIRPRANVRCESLVTPISVALETEGIRCLVIGNIKASLGESDSLDYVSLLTNKLGKFDVVMYDSDVELAELTGEVVRKDLGARVQKARVRVCACGEYEELESVRMYGLRKVSGKICIHCSTTLEVVEREVLMAEIVWPEVSDFDFNRKWVGTDFENFRSRQQTHQKISKASGRIRIAVDGHDFGIRYQILWATLIAYMAGKYGEREVTIHYVNKVQDKVFFIGSLAKILMPGANITFKALPLVWLDDEVSVGDCTSSHTRLLGKSLSTKRKELHVSLKSWRY